MQLKNHTENEKHNFYLVSTLPWISWALFIIFFNSTAKSKFNK